MKNADSRLFFEIFNTTNVSPASLMHLQMEEVVACLEDGESEKQRLYIYVADRAMKFTVRSGRSRTRARKCRLLIKSTMFC